MFDSRLQSMVLCPRFAQISLRRVAYLCLGPLVLSSSCRRVQVHSQRCQGLAFAFLSVIEGLSFAGEASVVLPSFANWSHFAILCANEHISHCWLAEPRT